MVLIQWMLLMNMELIHLRFFLTTNSAPGMDLRYIPEKLEASWNFINKIWNSATFCFNEY